MIIDDKGNALLCDPGLAPILDGGVTGFTSLSSADTLRYTAPELLDDNQATTFSDVYSVGCMCMRVRTTRALYLYPLNFNHSNASS